MSYNNTNFSWVLVLVLTIVVIVLLFILHYNTCPTAKSALASPAPDPNKVKLTGNIDDMLTTVSDALDNLVGLNGTLKFPAYGNDIYNVTKNNFYTLNIKLYDCLQKISANAIDGVQTDVLVTTSMLGQVQSAVNIIIGLVPVDKSTGKIPSPYSAMATALSADMIKLTNQGASALSNLTAWEGTWQPSAGYMTLPTTS